MKKPFIIILSLIVLALLFIGCEAIIRFEGEELSFLRDRAESDMREFYFNKLPYIIRKRWQFTGRELNGSSYTEFIRVDQKEGRRLLHRLRDGNMRDLQYYYNDGVLYFHDRVQEIRSVR